MMKRGVWKVWSSVVLGSWVMAGLCGAAAAQPGAAPDVAAAPALVSAVRGVAITVSDLEVSVAWYTGVLSFEQVGGIETRAGESFERLTGTFAATARVARLTLGDEVIELMEFTTPRGRPVPTTSRGNDLWFQHVAIIVRDMDEAYARVREAGVRHASPGPQRLPDWNAGAAGIEAFYFRDPDGHFLELLEFPAGKGEPRWQSDDRVFLGIDHTAITVASTEAALRYYRDFLGLRVVGGNENYGPEQERLNAVFPARLRITTLRAAGGGPAIELLEYLTPGTGLAAPHDSTPADLWHWHVICAGRSLDAAFSGCREAGGRAISPGPQASGASGGRGLMLRDGDGHAVLLEAGEE